MASAWLNHGIVRQFVAASGAGAVCKRVEKLMNEDVFNVSIRKFLKTLGVTAQREIEKAVREALADGRLKGNEKLPAKAIVSIGAVKFNHEVNGDIALE
jgi:hypothetical protein